MTTNLTPDDLAPVPNEPAPADALVLEVRRGRTGQPLRPVLGCRFLIGNGQGCDLRLNGDVPPIHSVLFREGGHVWLEAVAAVPPLAVNGHPVERTLLSQGDEIEIGPFRILVHRPHLAALESAPLAEYAPDVRPTSDDDAAFDPAGLTAAELVERIEQEEAQVEQFTRRRQTGADSLLAAVLARAEARCAATPADDASSAVIHPAELADVIALPLVRVPHTAAATPEVDRLNDGLIALSSELRQRLNRLRQRDAAQADGGRERPDAPDQLIRRLDTTLRQTHRTGPRRKAA